MELVLPDPSVVTLARVKDVATQSALIREHCRKNNDLAMAEELRRRLDAFARYVSDRKARAALEAEARRTEVLIGELLGPAEIGRPKVSAPETLHGINDEQRRDFRALALEADLVEEQLEAGITARAQILRQIDRKQRIAEQATKSTSDYQLFHADFSEVELDPVDVIVTDPPYDKDAVGAYAAFSLYAASVLRPGGSAFVMIGQAHLPEALTALTSSLNYHWMLAYLTPGAESPQAPLFARRVNSFWKPIIWLVNGSYEGPALGDVTGSRGNEKRFHDWEQSVSGMADLLQRASQEGDRVLDPFCGSGTTGIACLLLGRRFIGIDRDQEILQVAASRLAEVG